LAPEGGLASTGFNLSLFWSPIQNLVILPNLWRS
jgi:hypothetical protein